jgi:predicted TIM-barrel fold metal-dependent hydrolase
MEEIIIDADTHITPTGEGITFEELLGMMEKAGVAQAVVWLQPPYVREHIEQCNRYVYQAVQAFPEHFIGFGWVDPNLGLERSKDLIKRCFEDYGFYGVKFNGAQNEYFVDDPHHVLPLIEEVAKRGKVLAFHVGADAYERTHPFRIAKIAHLFPETKILAVHMGGVGFPSLCRAMVEFAQECPNIFLVGSMVGVRDIDYALRNLGPERLCFGSDTPFSFMHVEVAKYKALLQDFPPAWRERVMGENIRSVLGLMS